MATWQFDLHLLPRSEVGEISALPANEFDTRDWWTETQPPDSYSQDLERLLPCLEGWSADVRCFGTEEGDRVDLLLESGRVADIFVRLDLRAHPSEFSASLPTLAASWGCVIRVAESGSIIPADEELLSEALASSRAAAFVRDPRSFLAALSE